MSKHKKVQPKKAMRKPAAAVPTAQPVMPAPPVASASPVVPVVPPPAALKRPRRS